MKRTARDLYEMFGLVPKDDAWTQEMTDGWVRSRILNHYGQMARDQAKARARHERMLLSAARRAKPVSERNPDEGDDQRG
jgi:hypothetical protein